MKIYKQTDRSESCLYCKYFRSFTDIYEDDLESSRKIGRCYHPLAPSYEITSDELTCNEFEKTKTMKLWIEKN